jgi:hypothetical protein
MKLRHHHGRPVGRWPGRMLRGLRFDRNPLRRRSDRVETLLLGVLIAVFAIGTPLAAHAAGGWAHAAAERQARAQQTRLHRVPATLLQAAPAWDVNGAGSYPDTQARWTAAAGQVRTGWIFVPSGGSKGSTVSIWISQSGQPSNPPLQPGQIQGQAEMAGGAAVTVLAIVLLTSGLLARRALDRRRMAGWDAEWLAIGPRWSPGRC